MYLHVVDDLNVKFEINIIWTIFKWVDKTTEFRVEKQRFLFKNEHLDHSLIYKYIK